jgi:hypothetical protein
VLDQCTERDRTNVVLTNESAAMMKFPSGAALPGHRVTATAAGVSERIIVSVLVDASTNDDGNLESAVVDARSDLIRAGVPVDNMQVAHAHTTNSGRLSEQLAAARRGSRSSLERRSVLDGNLVSRMVERFEVPLLYAPPPSYAWMMTWLPKTWLLREGWKKRIASRGAWSAE